MNAAKLATRSETKSLIDSISKAVNEISDLSIDYWVNKAATESKNIQHHSSKIKGLCSKQTGVSPLSNLYIMNIMAKAGHVARYIEILKMRGFTIENSLLSMVLEKATLDCEIAYQLSKDDRAWRAQEVMVSCMDVMANLYTTFQSFHPPSNNLTIMQTCNKKFKEISDWSQSLG